jgi:hypothetical protein
VLPAEVCAVAVTRTASHDVNGTGSRKTGPWCIAIFLDGALATMMPARLAAFATRAACHSGSVVLRERRTRCAGPDRRSDRLGEPGERRDDPQRGTDVDCEFEVAAAQILHEGVAGDHHLRGPIGLEAAHRSQPVLELTVFAAHHDAGPGELTAVPVRACLAEAAGLAPATRKRKRGPRSPRSAGGRCATSCWTPTRWTASTR